MKSTRPAGTRPVSSNEYWETVRDHLEHDAFHGANPVVRETRCYGGVDRAGCTFRWGHTISDPETVAFIAAHCGRRLLDPLAGTGWWASLLAARGVDVVATDLYPPHADGRKPHEFTAEYLPVPQMSALEAADRFGADRTVLLSWPPVDDPVATDLLTARPWPAVIFMGETRERPSCGDEDMWPTLDDRYDLVAERTPVQWRGIHDVVHVYRPKPGAW